MRHIISSPRLIRTIHRMILKHPQNRISEDISTLLLAAGLQGKLTKRPFGQLWRSSIYQLFLFLSTASKRFTIWRLNPTGNLLKLPIRGHVQEKSPSRRQWRKGIRCSSTAASLECERSRAEFPYMKCTYLTTRRKVIQETPTDFF